MESEESVAEAECAFCHYVSTYEDVLTHISLHHDETEIMENSSSVSASMSESEGEKNKESCAWTDGETKLLLDKYEVYLNMIGPMKKFKTKKCMWQKISDDIKKILNVTRSPLQCENRYKTILKRKKKAIDSNASTGATREEIPFESELNKISAIDDSIEPEVCTDGKETVTKRITASGTGSLGLIRKRKKEKTIQEVLIDISNKKEEAKERRHKERLEVMREILKDFLKQNEPEK